MTFNIIYTPNSVQYLSFFVWSLLEYSPYHFRLVSNGCTPKERAHLKKMSELHPRLSYHCFPTNKMQAHGPVLDYLQGITQEEFFCFMDSDIFATEELPDFEAILNQKELTAAFSGMPLFVKASEYIFKMNFRTLLGTFNQSEEGNCLGSTYFAIYRKEDLTQIMQYYGLSFEEVDRSHLPPDIQKQLTQMSFNQSSFDTGKIIILFLNKHGYKLKNLPIHQLCHIGATSFETTYQLRPLGFTQKIRRSLETAFLRPLFEKLSAFKKEMYYERRFRNAPKEEYLVNRSLRVLHRDPTRQHFLQLFDALTKKQKIPSPPKIKDAEIREKVAKAHHDYIRTFRKYYYTNPISQLI